MVGPASVVSRLDPGMSARVRYSARRQDKCGLTNLTDLRQSGRANLPWTCSRMQNRPAQITVNLENFSPSSLGNLDLCSIINKQLKDK